MRLASDDLDGVASTSVARGSFTRRYAFKTGQDGTAPPEVV